MYVKYAKEKKEIFCTFFQVEPSLATEVLGEGASVFAHRGGSLDAPENTLAAFRLAKQNKAFGVEFDLSFTKDSVAVLLHDDDVDRTTNGTGLINQLTFDEVLRLNAAHNHIYSKDYENERIPTLEEGIEECLRLDLRMIIDVKEYDERVVPVLIKTFEQYPKLYERALVGSFYPQVVYSLRLFNPKIVTALIWRPYYLSFHEIERIKPRFPDSWWKQRLSQCLDPVLTWGIHNVIWYVTGVTAILSHKDCISREYVKDWQSKNVRTIAWTPNTPMEKDFLTEVLHLPIVTDTMI